MARISRREWCRRIVEYLRTAAEQEENLGYWDDYCIAWMTVAKAYHGENSPHFWATYEHLGTAPEKVWEMVEHQRKWKLFRLCGTTEEAPELPPKKAAQSAELPRAEVAAKEKTPAQDRNSRAGSKGEYIG